MTLREKINDTLLQLGMGDMSTYEAEDTILAAIREHMTSPEAVERAVAKFYAHNDRFDQAMNAAILAALEGEP